MKALSIRQPWANLISLGIKTIETRTWKTDYRGQLAIHASKSIDKSGVGYLEGYFSRENQFCFSVYPLGQIIALCSLVDIIEYANVQTFLSDMEKHLSPGYVRYGWVLDSVVILNQPVPYRGKLGLWDWQQGSDF
jgi:hypothetical protein